MKLTKPKEGKNWIIFFLPLHSKDNEAFFFLEQYKHRKSWLRIYALKLETSKYIITGGAIKLTQAMQDRQHTKIELQKLNRCRNFLKDKNIKDIGEFENFVEI